MPILEVRQLVKSYNGTPAVNGIDFAIGHGVCFGLLGPNGAGKTTTLEVVEGILPATSGAILYQGRPPGDRFREEVGIQFQHTSLLGFLTVAETIVTFQRLYTAPYALDALAELCNLTDVLQQKNDQLSGGQTQRLMLALALLNGPQLLFLDEPSTGLDPQARRNLWDIVLRVKAEGKTIVLTTHSMEEAEYLCDEIAIMDHGRIIARGTPLELIGKHCQGHTIILPGNCRDALPPDCPFPCHTVNNQLELHVDAVNDCLEYLLRHQVSLAAMRVRSPNLEDVFLNLTGRKLRD